MKSLFRLLIPVGAALAISGLLVTGASADDTNTNTNTQTGANTAASSQDVVAISGDAIASHWSVAESGDASASASSVQIQSIFQKADNQVSDCGCREKMSSWSDDVNTNTNTQTGTNTATSGQSTAAGSGMANATGGSYASSGNAHAAAHSLQKQFLTQLGANQSSFNFGN